MTECSLYCPGDTSQLCGEEDRYAFYKAKSKFLYRKIKAVHISLWLLFVQCIKDVLFM